MLPLVLNISMHFGLLSTLKLSKADGFQMKMHQFLKLFRSQYADISFQDGQSKAKPFENNVVG